MSGKTCSNAVQTTSETRQRSIGYIETDAALRDLLEAWGYPTVLNGKDHERIGKALGEFIRGKPYSRPYIANILAGKYAGEEIREGIMMLLAVADGARVESVKTHQVTIRTEAHITEGALVMRDSTICSCGIHFVPGSGRQRFHTPQCRQEFYRQQRRAKKNER